jgi:hypothetical protein
MSAYFKLKQTFKSSPFLKPIYQPLLKVDDVICSMFGHDPDFVVSGTGRSGTVYISWLLNELGIPTRHEYFFGPHGYSKRIGVKGEVSWMAAPFLGNFRGSILHQTRHPVKTINSFVSVKAVDPSRMHNKYIRFISQHFEMGEDLLEHAMRFYIDWNYQISQHATYHFQIEQVERCIPEIFAQLGVSCPKNYRHVIKRSKTLNSKSKPQVTYYDLPKGQLLDELIYVSERYGYKIDEA